MPDFYFKIAGLTFRVKGSIYSLADRLSDYFCDPASDATEIVLTDEDRAFERTQGEADGANWSDRDYEFGALLRKVATVALSRNRMFMHGACIAHRGRGYLFTAHSGTGKTTHIRLWMKYLGDDVQVVNGDRPVLTFDERVMVSGNPWGGKEGYQQNISVPLEGVILLKRGTVNAMRRVTVDEAMEFLYGQIFMITESDCALPILGYLDQLLSKVPVYELTCNMEEDALRCSFETLTGLDYAVEKRKWEGK